jgi:hypothetical protein
MVVSLIVDTPLPEAQRKVRKFKLELPRDPAAEISHRCTQVADCLFTEAKHSSGSPQGAKKGESDGPARGPKDKKMIELAHGFEREFEKGGPPVLCGEPESPKASRSGHPVQATPDCDPSPRSEKHRQPGDYAHRPCTLERIAHSTPPSFWSACPALAPATFCRTGSSRPIS